MALSNSQYNAVMREYEKRQLKNRHERDARIARVYQQVPQLKQLEQESALRRRPAQGRAFPEVWKGQKR